MGSAKWGKNMPEHYEFKIMNYRKVFRAAAWVLLAAAFVTHNSELLHATTITGTVQDSAGNAVSGAAITFRLINIGRGNVARDSGTSIVAPALVTATSASDGTFSVTLVGNDQITPAGTLYEVVMRGPGFTYGPFDYSITGSSEDLNSLTPEATYPNTPSQVAASQIVPPSGCSSGAVLEWTGTAWQCATAGAGSGAQHQVNGVNVAANSTVNFESAAPTNGVALSFSNPSAGNVQLTLSGTLDNAGLTHSSVMFNGQSASLGASANIPFSVNGANDSTLTGLNAITSTANAVGLTVTPSNPSGNNWKFEITGSNYSGNAATATALAAAPTQCTAGQFATGIATSGNANCATPAGGGNPGGSSGQVQINNSGSFGGAANLTYDSTSGDTTLQLRDKGGQAYNVKAYGAKGDGKWIFDGVVAVADSGSATDSGTSTSPTAPAVTTTANNSIAVGVFLAPTTWTSVPSTGTNRVNFPQGDGTEYSITINDQMVPTAGSVSSYGGTLASSVKWVTGQFYFPPASTISFVSANSGHVTSSTNPSITVNTPAGAQTGDMLVACAGWFNAPNAISWPSGFTEINTSLQTPGPAIDCKQETLGASIPPNFAWSVTGSSSIAVALLDYRGVRTGSTLTSATANFQASDAGKPICISGSSSQSCGTIASYTSSTQVSLSFITAAGSGLPFVYGTDDTTAFNSALTAAEAGGLGGTLFFPQGTYILTSSFTLPPNIPISIEGVGSGVYDTSVTGVISGTPPDAVGGSRLDWATKSLSGAALSFGSSANSTNYTGVEKLQNITLYGGAGNHRDGGGSDGLNIINWQNIAVKNAFIGNFAGNGVYMDGIGSPGHYLEAITLDEVYSFWNGGYGVKIGSAADPRILEAIAIRNSVIENNASPGIGFIGGKIYGFALNTSVVQWNNTSGANPELYWPGVSSDLQGCQIRGNYFEIDTLAGSKSNGLASAGLPCDFGTNYTQGGSAKFVRNDNGGNSIIPTGIRSGVATNTDLAGQVTLSGGTGTYTFTGSYTSAPICTASDTTAANAVKVSTTTTTLTLTGTTTDVINYACVGRN